MTAKALVFEIGLDGRAQTRLIVHQQQTYRQRRLRGGRVSAGSVSAGRVCGGRVCGGIEAHGPQAAGGIGRNLSRATGHNLPLLAQQTGIAELPGQGPERGRIPAGLPGKQAAHQI